MPIDPSIPLSVKPVDVAGHAGALQQQRQQSQAMQQQIELNALKLQEAKKLAGMDPAAEEVFMRQVVEEAGGDPHKIPEVLLRKGRIREALEFVKGWPADKGADPFTLSPGQARYDGQGNVIAQGPDAPVTAAQAAGFTLSPGQQRFDAEGKPIAGVPERKPTGGGSEPLVAIMGPDGLPVLVPRSQAAGKRPASNREQGRPVTSGDANRLTDLDSSLSDLQTLAQTVKGAGSTGIAPSLGAAMPNAITNATGFGTAAKERQAVIDRVKQVIGKALEGGVLRKEDEIKYAKILPTISDHPQVVATKLAGLQTAIAQRRSTLLDNLADAGYDTSRFESRGAAPTSGGIKVGPYTVREKK